MANGHGTSWGEAGQPPCPWARDKEQMEDLSSPPAEAAQSTALSEERAEKWQMEV